MCSSTLLQCTYVVQFVELTQNYLYRIIGLVHRKQQSSYYMMSLTAQQILPLLKIQLFKYSKYNFSLAQFFSVFQFFNLLLPPALFMYGVESLYSRVQLFLHFHSTSTVYFYSVQCTVGTKYYLQ